MGAVTAKMDKPLISLVLQQFGFLPAKRHFSCELSAERGQRGEMILWSANEARLRGMYSKMYRKRQNIVIASTRPTSSRTLYVDTAFELPDLAVAEVLHWKR